jgi:hypothetical protein
MTIPHIKSLSSSVRPFYCLWILHGCVHDFIHLSATDMAEIAESTPLNGVHIHYTVCATIKTWRWQDSIITLKIKPNVLRARKWIDNANG